MDVVPENYCCPSAKACGYGSTSLEDLIGGISSVFVEGLPKFVSVGLSPALRA
jgi:hypothetical protein